MSTSDVGLAFKRSGGRGALDGVEVARDPVNGGMVIRNSADPVGPELVFTADQWRALICSVALRQWPKTYILWDADQRWASMTVPGGSALLRFTAAQMEVFTAAVARGVFALPRGPQPGS